MRVLRWWRFWVELFSKRETGDCLALFRILVGTIVLYALIGPLVWDLVAPIWIDAAHGGMRRSLGQNFLVHRLGGPTDRVVWGLYWTAVPATLLYIAGLGGRITALVVLQTYYAISSINGDASGGYDLMISNGLWLTVLGNSTATLSLDCFLRHRRWQSDDRVAAWPRQLIFFQLVVVYCSTGWQKVSRFWTPVGGYSALYYILQDYSWIRFDGRFWAHPLLYFMTQVGTAITWHWEQLAPILLLIQYARYTRSRGRRLRRILNRYDLRLLWLGIGALLHVGILVLLNVGPFSWISLAYYVAAFTPDELRRGGQWLRRRLHRPRWPRPTAALEKRVA